MIEILPLRPSSSLLASRCCHRAILETPPRSPSYSVTMGILESVERERERENKMTKAKDLR